MNFCSKFYLFILLCFALSLRAQHTSTIKASLDDTSKTISIFQEVEYLNTSKDTLTEIYFMDWANAFSSKDTPLATRFNEDFRRAFHFSSEKDRGFTTINKTSINTKSIEWFRPNHHQDILGIKLLKPLKPSEKVKIDFQYTVKIPNDKYTRFGFTKSSYNIRYWHLSPSIYQNGWQLFSHKNLNDFSSQFSNYTIDFSLPIQYRMESNLVIKDLKVVSNKNELKLEGNHISNIRLFIEKGNDFYQTQINNKIISSDIPDNGLDSNQKELSTKKVYNFVKEYFGDLPQQKTLLSYKDYLKQPIYGFNQLPKGLKPFDKKFLFEIITLKELTNKAKRNTFISDLRTEQWFTDALQIYVMMKYVEKYYPKNKLAGKLSNIIGLKWFHASKLDFNKQYYIGVKNMASRFLEQPLGMPKDSLLKFNYNISNPYKAGMGLHYLESYLSKGELDLKIKEFTKQQRLLTTSAKQFKDKLQQNSSKKIDWFTNNFIYQDKITDVKINGISRTRDSVFVHLKNKGKPLPVKLSSFKKKNIISQKWTPVFSDSIKIGFKKKEATHFVIDYKERLPESSRRNNYRKTTGIFPKPFQFRLFQDIENPKFTQIYTVPVYDFNVYDGLILGARFLNKSLVPRNFSLSAVPSYGLKSKKLQGSASLGYTYQLKKYGWSFLNFGVSGSTSSYAPELSFVRYTPSISLSYRPKDLRKNISQRISTRFVSIDREAPASGELETPNYNVFNTRYRYFDNNLTRVFGFNADFQLSDNFSRISSTFNFRKLFVNNRQINFRAFAGAFLKNETSQDGDFFSFALDRPSDYLFDFGYFARDDNSGLASQQFINAEGNFKSFFGDKRFANEWIATSTVETNIWNWIFVYADGGFIKSKNRNPEWLYDTGIRLNLVQDYFELYFPLQSSLGFEPSFKDYGQRIRFKATLSFDTVIQLFTREWY